MRNSRPWALFLLVAIQLLSIFARAEQSAPKQSLRPVIAVYWDCRASRPGKGETFPVIVAIWNDGTIIWSKEPVNGGAPYFKGHIEPKELTQTLTVIREKVKDKEFKKFNVGFDSAYTRIAIDDAESPLFMASWHEGFESNPKLVDTANGITSLDGRDRKAVWEKQPEEYKTFRAVWAYIKESALALIPKEGEAVQDITFGRDTHGDQTVILNIKK